MFWSAIRADARSNRVDVLLIGMFLAVAFLLGCRTLYDTDVWWHIRTGQWIAEHHRVPG